MISVKLETVFVYMKRNLLKHQARVRNSLLGTLTVRNVHKDVSYCLELLAKNLPKSQLEVVKRPTSGGSELNNMILQGVLKIPKSVLFFSPKFPSA